ncbi:MAG: polysaccharide deacetylase family protein, partial [Bacteroidia bacterium]
APNDKNLPHTNPLMQELIKNISAKAETGIHPSFASNQSPGKVKIEKERLEKIKTPLVPLIKGERTAVTKSRQHFLMLRFPYTYKNLIASGIKDDYTMGFADELGFRAGICTPYLWYDLEKEEETNLMIHPFAVMDGTLNNYLKLSPEQAIEKIKEIVKEIKSVNGEFISIWHNETLSDWREWKGWRDVYEKVIQIAK